MRRHAIAILVTFGVILALAGAVGLYARAEYTECYATFRTDEGAERAAESVRDAGHDADVDNGSVTFSSGETGADAREFRGAFQDSVRREGGEHAHPDGGCIERSGFE